MDTESRSPAPDHGDPAEETPDRDIPVHRPRPLWVEEPVGTARMPDPVRTAAVRAVLVASVTLIEATVAMLAAAGNSWLATPTTLCTVVSAVVATWAVLDVWVTRQVWNQRNGVVSSPSSAARALRRERRRARRAARSPRARLHDRRHRLLPGAERSTGCPMCRTTGPRLAGIPEVGPPRGRTSFSRPPRGRTSFGRTSSAPGVGTSASR